MNRKPVLAGMIVIALLAGAAFAGAGDSFDIESLQWMIQTLVAPGMDGREAGTPGAVRAADAVLWQFRAAGLVPRGTEGYYQTFEHDFGPGGGGVRTLRNVVGVVDPSRPGKALLIGAHYDHLGTKDGVVYPGADDNASGVALLCALASAFHADNPHDGPVVFAAFTGEEEGMLGSEWYVEHPPYPLSETVAAVNIDMVGRLGEKPLLLAAEGLSAEERNTFYEEAGRIGGGDLALPVQEMRSGFEAGDLKSLALAHIPTLMIFTGAHADYHRPTDTENKIDYAGLARVGRFLSEAAPFFARLAEGGFAGEPAFASAPREASGDRPFLGTVPDFTASGGAGVLVSEVVPGSPADRAGIRAGDLVTGMDGAPITDLRGYADALRARKPGDRVVITVVREGARADFEAILGKKSGDAPGGQPHGAGTPGN